MARKPRPIEYDVTDDLTDEVIDEKDAETVTFGFNGKSYEIETHRDNRAKLEDILAEWIAKAKEVKPETRRATPEQNQNAGWSAKDVRAWWSDNGGKNGLPAFQPNGRIFKTVYEAFNKKHPAK
ncbi:Lsr2 dimerization domain-containing protein [Microbacterium oleivorans]|uniref:Lsr2 family protein n=1 Tax=Microbacterium oleivorans TaxID=273677 RepID=A0A4V3B370_9MICO|nr:histone-like nucleoid-structuring protein Lsr2 [Microbacterium oleivorans]TDL43590.1 Lsr2 family protein [Microbacterium oleivorans]